MSGVNQAYTSPIHSLETSPVPMGAGTGAIDVAFGRYSARAIVVTPNLAAAAGHFHELRINDEHGNPIRWASDEAVTLEIDGLADDDQFGIRRVYITAGQANTRFTVVAIR